MAMKMMRLVPRRSPERRSGAFRGDGLARFFCVADMEGTVLLFLLKRKSPLLWNGVFYETFETGSPIA